MYIRYIMQKRKHRMLHMRFYARILDMRII